jgi:hypothetical protein
VSHRLPATVAEVVQRLRAIRAEMRGRDGAGIFNAMYLDVTERVLAALEAGSFADPAFMTDLDIRFANLWIDAYDAANAGRALPSAWKPLFEQRRKRGLLPIQFALAGMNAHIEHDLPIAVIATCKARRRTPADPDVREDYDRVNAVLASVEVEIRRSFLTTVGRRIDAEAGAAVHLVSAWNIDKARDLAWVSVEMLWAVRDLDRLAARYRSMLSHTVGLTSRYLLTPLPAPPLTEL